MRTRAGRPALVLVHGRGYAGSDEGAVRSTWLGALREGLGEGQGGALDGLDVRLAFYGDVLGGFLRQPADASIADAADAGYEAFLAAALDDVRAGLGVPEVGAARPGGVRAQGPLAWPWVLAVLRAIDRVPGVSAAAVERLVRDAYLYLTRAPVRDAVNDVLRGLMPAGPAVVVGHSLGSVVAYDALRTMGPPADVPLLVTLGSPLGLRPVRAALAPLRFPPGVGRWLNAFDPRDAVALHPLDARRFPVDPPVENHGGVRNPTRGAHGIEGYLADPVVAARIRGALA